MLNEWMNEWMNEMLNWNKEESAEGSSLLMWEETKAYMNMNGSQELSLESSTKQTPKTALLKILLLRAPFPCRTAVEILDRSSNHRSRSNGFYLFSGSGPGQTALYFTWAERNQVRLTWSAAFDSLGFGWVVLPTSGAGVENDFCIKGDQLTWAELSA